MKIRMVLLLMLVPLSRGIELDVVRAQSPDAQDAVKLKTTLVNVPVIVSDRNGRYLSGLHATDFTILSDHVKQPVAVFETTEEPLNVALLLDTSWSTRDVLDDIKSAAKSFASRLGAQDRATVICFDHDIHVLTPLTADRQALTKAIDRAGIGARPGTVLRDAVMETVKRAFHGIEGRKAIVLLTDGKDHGSRTDESELLQTAEESGAMIYSVFYATAPGAKRAGWRGGVFGRAGGGERRRERAEGRNENAAESLQQLTDASDGRFFRSEVTDLKQTFDLIAEELRHQYRLGFYAHDDGPDGTPHRITVQVNAPGAVVRARHSYRAGQQNN